MPLVKATLQAEIVSAFNANMTGITPSSEQTQQVNALASAIATAVDNYIKSATVTSTPLLIAPPGGGPVTGTITNVIS